MKLLESGCEASEFLQNRSTTKMHNPVQTAAYQNTQAAHSHYTFLFAGVCNHYSEEPGLCHADVWGWDQ